MFCEYGRKGRPAGGDPAQRIRQLGCSMERLKGEKDSSGEYWLFEDEGEENGD